jgi:hypothetical protein
LKSAGMVRSYGSRDSAAFPIECINLTDKEETGFRLDHDVRPVSIHVLRTKGYAQQLLDTMRDRGVTLGYQPHANGAVTGRHQSAKPNLAPQAKAASLAREFEEELTLSEALYRDRLAAARTVPDCKPYRDTMKKEVNPVTVGDQTVSDVRKKTLAEADKALMTLKSTSELFKKFGVDAELKEALEKGLKGMEPYFKLRKKGRE